MLKKLIILSLFICVKSMAGTSNTGISTSGNFSAASAAAKKFDSADEIGNKAAVSAEASADAATDYNPELMSEPTNPIEKVSAAKVNEKIDSDSLEKTVSLKESEIPVVLEAQKKSDSSASSTARILFSILVLGALGGGILYFSKRHLKDSAKRSQATQIKVLTQHYLGPKKSLAIIRVAGESILIGVTDHNISLIKQLSLLDDDLPEETSGSFGAVLKSKSPPVSTSSTAFEEAGDEFAISGIKDIVRNRLKNMRTF